MSFCHYCDRIHNHENIIKTSSSSSSSSSSSPSFSESSDIKQCVTLLAYAYRILNTHDKHLKASLTLEAQKAWKEGRLTLRDEKFIPPPDMPARPKDLNVVEPSKIAQRGKAGTLANRIAMIHSLAHIESFAIDLSWDILYRFAIGGKSTNNVEMPTEFYEDWLRIAAEEASHYSIWAHRLEELGSFYGQLAVHNGLWESAHETSHSLLARLAIVHMVHESRGLDVCPQTLSRFRSANDPASAELLERIYEDEITHVTSGMRWFRYICEHSTPPLDPISTFHEIVRKHFRGVLKPPFNTEARKKAGFTEDWYMPLTTKTQLSSNTNQEEEDLEH